MPRSVGLALVVLGIAVAAIGFLIWSGALGWFGRLPGDVRLERPGVRIYLPIVSMLIVSAVLSLALAIIRRLK